jgi:hypothetical protein
MGCDYYEVDGFSLHFSEDQGDWGCLCTFPYNWQQGQKLAPDDIRSLALLGAAAAIAHQEAVDAVVNKEPICSSFFPIPSSVPLWIQDEIRRLVPDAPCVEFHEVLTSTDLAYSTTSERD